MDNQDEEKTIEIALAGNANVGKSVIFNALTGLNQSVGNWPGKTVERAEGTLFYKGYKIRVIDLPGIYSLSVYSMEEIVTRDYISSKKADFVINVIDASALERNLFFTFQLMEMEAPIIIALNQIDFAEKKGIKINAEKLSELLGVPVFPTIAIRGTGIDAILNYIIDVKEKKKEFHPSKIKYGKEVEEAINLILEKIKENNLKITKFYPARWIAIKLLEQDEQVIQRVMDEDNGKVIIDFAEKIAKNLEEIHGEPSWMVLTSERYSKANRIATAVEHFERRPKRTKSDLLEEVTAGPRLGLATLVVVMVAIFYGVFTFGAFLEDILTTYMDMLMEYTDGLLSASLGEFWSTIIVDGFIGGIASGIAVAIPYIMTFYLIISFLEDSGYLPRAAFVIDSFMHKIGLHGKAFIPMIISFGCNVPAIAGTKIMETRRERLIAAMLSVMVPCSATTVVILGIVAKFIGILPALGLYLLDIILIIILGKILYRWLPGEGTGLIMEIPAYKLPSIKNVVIKAWINIKEFLIIALPVIGIGSVFLEFLYVTNYINAFSMIFNPLIVGVLHLPEQTTVPLILGILRKEMTLILIAEAFGTTNLAAVMTPVQMIVFTAVTMIYIPCIATIAALIKEFGWKISFLMTIITIALAVVVGAILAVALPIFML